MSPTLSPKIYTKFECYEIEVHKHLENIWIYEAKQFMFTKNNFKQRICILEDGASGAKVGEILVYSFGSLLLKLEQRSRVVHFTMLAPIYSVIYEPIEEEISVCN